MQTDWLVDLSGAARLVRMSRRFLEHRAATGELAVLRLGRSVRVEVDVLKAWARSPEARRQWRRSQRRPRPDSSRSEKDRPGPAPDERRASGL
jgi:hypothetical protein